MRRIVVLILLILAGCRSSRVSQLTDDVEVSQVVPCGQAFVGFESTCSVTVTNRARRAVSVTFTNVSPFELPASIDVPAGQSSDVEVHFRPLEVGEVSRTITASFEGNDVEVQLSGEGVVVPSCVATDDCREQTFDPSRGCVETVRADGASCGQRNSCLVNATCQAGQCVGAPRSCDDGSACTTDACDPTRGCLHETVTCAPSTNPCLAAACDARLGCVAEPVVDGTSCGANDCETAQVCFSGQCVERAAPEGSICAPATACRGEGRCTAAKSCALPEPGAPTEAFRFDLPADRVVQQLLVSTAGETFFAHGPQDRTPASAVLVALDRLGRTRFEVDLTAEVPGTQTVRALMLDAPNHRLFVSLSAWAPALEVLQARDSRTGALLWQKDLRALNIPIVNTDTGALHLYTQSLSLAGTDDVLVQLIEGYTLHLGYLVAFSGASGVERWRTQRLGHGSFLVNGSGEAWGSWAACWSGDYGFARIDGSGRPSTEVRRMAPMAMLGDTAIVQGLDGGLVSLASDLRTERGFPLPPNQYLFGGVAAQGDELTVLTGRVHASSAERLVRSTETGVRWEATLDPFATSRSFGLVADGGVALSYGYRDGGASLSLLSNDGDELERCSMNGRTLSGFADELIISTEKGRIVGLRFPGLGAAKAGWPNAQGVDGTRRWR